MVGAGTVEFEMADATGGKAARYAIEDSHGRVTATRTQVVRGIALKTEPLSVEDWIQEVGAAIAGEVDRNKAARDALRDLL